MKNLFATLLVCLVLLPGASALAGGRQQLDGTTLSFTYTSGRGVDMQIDSGLMSYQWHSGPRKGKGNSELPYQSRKIGHKRYLFSWLEASNPDHITLVLDFETGVVYSSGIARFGTDKQFLVFSGGLIDEFSLVEQD